MMNVTNSEQSLKSYCKSKGYEKPIYAISSRNFVYLDDRMYPKIYTCSVTVNGQHLANGNGISKRIARKKAAMIGLQNLRIMELSHLFTVFQNSKQTRAIEHEQSSSRQFTPSIEIEEITSIGNSSPLPMESSSISSCSTRKLSEPKSDYKKLDDEKKSDIIQETDQLESFILSAIAKLRSYDETVENEKDQIVDHHVKLNEDQIKKEANQQTDIPDLTENIQKFNMENKQQKTLDPMKFIDASEIYPSEFMNQNEIDKKTYEVSKNMIYKI